MLTNHTSEDFRIESDSDVTYAVRLMRQNALTTMPKDAFKLEFPIIMPANQRVYVPLELNGASYKAAENDELPQDERRKFRQQVEEYFRAEYGNMTGFQLMIDARRIAVDLPGGWIEPTK